MNLFLESKQDICIALYNVLTSKALRYGTCWPGIPQFYLPNCANSVVKLFKESNLKSEKVHFQGTSKMSSISDIMKL